MNKHPLDNSDLDDSSKRQRKEDPPLPDQQVVAQHRLENQLHTEETLCDDCTAVDWSSVPTLAADGLLGIKGLKLRRLNATYEELRDSSCPVCAILSTIIEPYRGRPRLELRAVPLSSRFNSRSVSGTFRDKHPVAESTSQCTVLILVHEWDNYYPDSKSLAAVRLDGLQSRKIAPSLIDYQGLKSLVETCQEEHKRCCKAGSRPNVLDLKVIDLGTHPLRVIRAPDQCEYLALSYVWGEQPGDMPAHDLEKAPAVIKDAVSVVKSMGYKYLWVDRYVSTK